MGVSVYWEMLDFDIVVVHASFTLRLSADWKLSGGEVTFAGAVSLEGEIDVLGLVSVSASLVCSLRYESAPRSWCSRAPSTTASTRSSARSPADRCPSARPTSSSATVSPWRPRRQVRGPGRQRCVLRRPLRRARLGRLLRRVRLSAARASPCSTTPHEVMTCPFTISSSPRLPNGRKRQHPVPVGPPLAAAAAEGHPGRLPRRRRLGCVRHGRPGAAVPAADQRQGPARGHAPPSCRRRSIPRVWRAVFGNPPVTVPVEPFAFRDRSAIDLACHRLGGAERADHGDRAVAVRPVGGRGHQVRRARRRRAPVRRPAPAGPGVHRRGRQRRRPRRPRPPSSTTSSGRSTPTRSSCGPSASCSTSRSRSPPAPGRSTPSRCGPTGPPRPGSDPHDEVPMRVAVDPDVQGRRRPARLPGHRLAGPRHGELRGRPARPGQRRPPDGPARRRPSTPRRRRRGRSRCRRCWRAASRSSAATSATW